MQYALDHLWRVTLSVHVHFIRVLVRRAGQVNEVPVLMPLSVLQYAHARPSAESIVASRFSPSFTCLARYS